MQLTYFLISNVLIKKYKIFFGLLTNG